jgi:hypothetical protein
MAEDPTNATPVNSLNAPEELSLPDQPAKGEDVMLHKEVDPIGAPVSSEPSADTTAPTQPLVGLS